ncbi:hypothetical protein ACFLSU_08980 [Bacteroidota bacterium]
MPNKNLPKWKYFIAKYNLDKIMNILQKTIAKPTNAVFSVSCSEIVFKKILPLLEGTFIKFHVFQPEDKTIPIQSDCSKLVFIAHLSHANELEILEKLLATTNKELECILISPFAFEGNRINTRAKIFIDQLDVKKINYKLITSKANNKPFGAVFDLQYQEVIELIKQFSKSSPFNVDANS